MAIEDTKRGVFYHSLSPQLFEGLVETLSLFYLLVQIQIKLGKLDDVLNHSSENQNIELLKKYLQSIKKHNIDFSLLEDKINFEKNDEIKE